jgi:hypothetical protein
MSQSSEIPARPVTADDAGAVDELIAALQRAHAGDRQLDLRIEYCIGVILGGRLDLARLMIDEGFSWDKVSNVLEGRVPPYTTSLDAAVENENIVFVIRSDKRGKWGAIHRDADGEEHLAWAADEKLARRCAAMKGLRAGLAVAAPADEGEQAGEPGADWKILF